MGNIIKSDSKIIGEHEAVSDEKRAEMQKEAQNAMAAARLGEGVDLSRISSRVRVGRFIALDMGGHIAAQAVWYQSILEKAAEKLSKDLESSTDVAQNVATAGAIKDVAIAASGLMAVQLKSVEIMAHGGKKKEKQSGVPQAVITGQNPQIIVGSMPSSNGVASQPVKP